MANDKQAKHTPGPWHYQKNSKVVAGGFDILLAHHDGEDAAVWEANARLIAAAPELLGILQGIVESASDGRSVPEWLAERIVAACAVLDRVEGRQ